MGDPERTGMPEKHFDFYYGKYFTKKIAPKSFGKESLQEVLIMAKDVIASNEEEVPILELKLTDEIDTLDIFCKLTEDVRRERQRRIDAGDETAKIKFTPSCMTNRITAQLATAGVSAAKPPGVTGALKPALPSGGASLATRPVRPPGQAW